MQPGDQVRLIENPSRIGVLVNQESIGEGRRKRLVVRFDDGLDTVLASSLEKIQEFIKDPFILMGRGEYAGVASLRGAVTSYRLSGRLANLIYSLNTTNTRFLPYQFKPVLQYLDSPSRGIVIADEVGLGKTIEAGLIWTELRARQDAKRLMVVCPAMLQDKWCAELSNRFGVKAEKMRNAAEVLERLQKVQEGAPEEFALVASMQGMRPPKGWRSGKSPSNAPAARLARFLEAAAIEDPLLNLVIIDEAHYLRNAGTQTHTFGQLLRSVTDGMVMLSATPIQMRSTDLFNLLRLLDPDAFPLEWTYDLSVRANAPIVALRDRLQRETVSQLEFKDALEESVALRWFDDSEQVQHLLKNLPSDEQLSSPRGRAEYADLLDRLNPRAKVITRTLKRYVSEFRVTREPSTIQVIMTAAERAFYEQVTEAVREHCELNSSSEGFLLTIPQRQMSSCMAAACEGWRKKIGASGESDLDEDLIELDTPDPEGANYSAPHSSGGELIRLLQSIAQRVGDDKALAASDSKFTALLHALKTYWHDNPGKKVVLFAFYRKTLHYLRRRLAEVGITSAVLHGDMDKQGVLQSFEDPAGPSILLSSEVASEGVDLQFSSLLVNYDLPWNPAKIEQRIGRIDRIGQEASKILIWNLVYADSLDDRVYSRLLTRLNIFKSTLGAAEEVLGEQVRQLTTDLLSHKLTPAEEERRIEQTALALETIRITQEQLDERAFQLLGHGDFIQNKAKAAMDLGRYIRGEDLYHYIKDFLEKKYPGSRLLVNDEPVRKGRIELSVDARVAFGHFLAEANLQGKTSILANQSKELWFDNQLGHASNSIEKITQDHPLVRFISTSQAGVNIESVYSPTSAIELAGHQVPAVPHGIYVYQVMRWNFSGPRDIERLVYEARSYETGEPLDEDLAEFLVNSAALHGLDWQGTARNVLKHARVASLQDDCRAKLEDRYFQAQGMQTRENRDRVREINSALEQDLLRRRTVAENRIASYEASGDQKYKRLIPMELGKLKKLTLKYEERIHINRQKESILPDQKSVTAGVIHLD